MDAVIIIFGMVATILSAVLGARFNRIPHPLARNIAWMAYGGALAGFCTLVFSYTSWAGIYGHLPNWLVFSLRIGIYGGITVADVLMLLKIRKIEGGDG